MWVPCSSSTPSPVGCVLTVEDAGEGIRVAQRPEAASRAGRQGEARSRRSLRRPHLPGRDRSRR
jgi:hypothetical protein